jgi:hypothetical protein
LPLWPSSRGLDGERSLEAILASFLRVSMRRRIEIS